MKKIAVAILTILVMTASCLHVMGATGEPVGAEFAGGELGAGSFYLTEDRTFTQGLTVKAGQTTSIDLNGHTLTIQGTVNVASGASLTFTDTATGGTVCFSGSSAVCNGGLYNVPVISASAMYGNNVQIKGGTFNGEFTNQSGSSVTKGTFKGKFNNMAAVYGGTFDGEFINSAGATVTSGTFAGKVTNQGKISGGTFNGPVVNSEGAEITGGLFYGSFANHSGSVSQAIFYGSSVSGITESRKVEFRMEQGGDILCTEYVLHGEKLKKPGQPSKPNHTFKGWKTGADVDFDFNSAINEDMTGGNAIWAAWESNEVTATPVPATSTPIPTNTPVPVTATPVPTNTPVPATPTAEPTGTPVPTGTPEPTATPLPTGTPASVTETPAPTVTVTPAITSEPTGTPTPKPTKAPKATPTPTASPEITETPEPTDEPEITDVPEPTDMPEITETPEPTETPVPTATPAPTAAPEVTEGADNQNKKEAGKNPVGYFLALLALLTVICCALVIGSRKREF